MNFSLLFPLLQKFRTKKAFLLYTCITVLVIQPPTAIAAFFTQSLLDFTSTTTTHGQGKHCAQGLTLPKAPLQTHTINNNMKDHNYAL